MEIQEAPFPSEQQIEEYRALLKPLLDLNAEMSASQEVLLKLHELRTLHLLHCLEDAKIPWAEDPETKGNSLKALLIEGAARAGEKCLTGIVEEDMLDALSIIKRHGRHIESLLEKRFALFEDLRGQIPRELVEVIDYMRERGQIDAERASVDDRKERWQKGCADACNDFVGLSCDPGLREKVERMVKATELLLPPAGALPGEGRAAKG